MQIKDYEIISHSVTGQIAIFITDLSSRRLHYHSDFELGLVLDGSIDIHLDDTHTTLSKGDIYCINRFQLHSITGSGANNHILACQIRSDLYSHIHPDLARIHVKSAFTDKDASHGTLHDLILSCGRAFFFSEKDYELKCTYSLLHCLYLLASDPDSFRISDKDERSTRHASARINRIIEYIENNYTHHISLAEIAESEGLSTYYLSHFIKDSLGCTFQDYVNRLRFEHAYLLLTTTSYSLLEVSLESGFSNTRYLHKCFIKNLGHDANAIRYMNTRPDIRISNPLADKESILPIPEAQKCLSAYGN